MADIMIIDDDRDFAAATATVLEAAGHEVDIKTDIADAERRMLARKPDLAILDVMFPEDASAGFALARRMRHQLEPLAGVPILMLTAVNQRFPLGFGQRDIDPDWLPVADFIEKPVDLHVLVARVALLLQGEEEAEP